MREFLTALVIIFLAFSGLAVDGPWQSNSVWYSFEEPADLAGQVLEPIDVEGQTVQHGQSRFEIADLAEENLCTTLEIPRGSWTKFQLFPAASGELKLYVRYPTGTVDLVLQGPVKEGQSYRAWYLTEETGDYHLWFTVNSDESNGVELQVIEGYEMAEGFSGPGMGRSGAASPVMYSVAPAAAAPSIGLSTGGAKDINNFRENIEQGYLPLPSDITYEGLFYDYYFQTGQQKECQKLFCPSYSYAVSRDPFSGEPQHYLSVGLNSGLSDFSRKMLNLVVVLDYSGSMGSPFSEYYYDRFGNMVQPEEAYGSEQSKMQIADQAVVDLTGHLTDDDRFGMVVFSDNAFTLDPLTFMSDKDPEKLKERILQIEATDGTNMESGMKKGTSLLEKYRQANASEYENRIIFLTDAMPNIGETGESALLQMLKENADRGIYTTFIGIGVDFNTELVENITKIKGANYYSVHSASEFQKRMDEEFDYMVTPLVFDLRLDLDAPGYRIEKVYGSPEADEATGEIMKVNTLFPSKAEDGEVKGGMILIKLKQISPEESIRLKVSYQDRNGTADFDQAEVEIEDIPPDYYQNDGIRKAVLLSRYADLLKDWMLDQRTAAALDGRVIPTVTLENGIVIPIELGQWERQSLPLQVADPYQKIFAVFESYFQKESEAVGDRSLQQEQAILERLSQFEST
jgi:Ca-activated chloride channel family protein